MRDFHLPGRSPTIARNGMAATSHPLASLAAIEVLKSGGNALDAAVTATAALCVIEPAMTGIGGDCFALIAKPGSPPIAFNASGRAPKAATAAWYEKAGIKTIETTTPHAVTIPGAIRGWARLLADHGTRTLAQVLGPAIAYAEGGFPVAPRVSHDWKGLVPKLSLHAGAREHLLLDGRPPRMGEIMRMPALARSLKKIAAEGPDAFYKGEIAADLVDTLRAAGGLHTLEDFAAQDANYVTPISVRYKDVELYELPPNNQGIVALILLKMLEKLGSIGKEADGADRAHVTLEAARLAFALRDAFVADPVMADVPVAHMLSDAVIGELVGRIDRNKRKADLGPVPRPQGTDTTYLTVADKDGMMVSFINSLFAGFGSGIVGRKSGIVLQNRGQGFVLDPRHPNAIAPRKRPLHTLVPALALRDGKPWASFGVMGGAYQPLGHAWVLTNMLDYGLDPQQAIDAPRVYYEGDMVQLERGYAEGVMSDLAARGHKVARRADPWGGGQLIVQDPAHGVLIGASDPRKDGLALGY